MTPRRSSRRLSRALVALLVLAVALGAAPGVGLGQEEELRETQRELRETRERMHDRADQLHALQRDMNRLATEIARNEDQIHRSNERLAELEVTVAEIESQMAVLQSQLDERNREALIAGPSSPVLYLLTATSAAEAAARVSILSEMNRRDEVLAAAVEETRERLSRAKAEQVRLQLARELAMRQLEIQEQELSEKMERSRELFEQLGAHREVLLDTISRLRPFAVCPVGTPHAVSDSFGIWVHRTEENGGDHVHQGNDIMAPMGTPIYAPFDGTAVTATNKIGGMAVKVFGEYGYVYNAHLSRFGQLGAVEQGDVIGYVGATGNAGGPHDHFEWHPNGGAAVDPYPFLMIVC
jgi:murein DD-endopeptidase MepM/ murein hydrolase activator NlpD